MPAKPDVVTIHTDDSTYDREAFIAGWHLGQIMAWMEHPDRCWLQDLPVALVPLVENAAAEWGYNVEVTASGLGDQYRLVNISSP